jgi:hypothetical protein
MTPELERLLEQARNAPPMTPAQMWDQRVSYAYGMLPFSSTRTREQVEAAVIKAYGPRPEDTPTQAEKLNRFAL